MAVQGLTTELEERYRREGAWRPRSFAEQVDAAAESQMGKLALSDGIDAFTYVELVNRTRAIANGLLRLGVGRGDVVAVQSPNRVWLPLLHVACNRIGAVFLPLSASWRHTEIRHLVALSRAVLLCIPPDTDDFSYRRMVDDIRPDLPGLKAIVSLADGEGPTLEDLASEGTNIKMAPALPSEWSYCMVSSGTTTLPKISKWTDLGLNALLQAGFGERVRLTSDDIAVALAPANTGATGYVFPVVAPLQIGATSIMLPKWSPEGAIRVLADSGATIATAIPTQMVQMLQVSALTPDSVPTLTRFNNGGAPLAPEAALEIERRLGCRVHSMYGATDGGVPLMTDIDDPDEVRLSTVGRVVPGMRLRVIDPLGREQHPGDAGEVVYQGLQKTFGYANEPDRDDEMFPDGWYHSGDVGMADGSGNIRIVGRIKEMIIRGGQNISPREVEEAILRHPEVGQVAVVGVPDPVMGERTCAFVVPSDPAAPPTLESIKEHMLGLQMAKFKLPERLEIIDALPMSAGSKILKSELLKRISKEATA